MGGLINYSALPFTVRDNIVTSQRLAWKRLAAPGTWWDGAMRVAIASEARQAKHCKFCAARREALSSQAIHGQHESKGLLSDALTEVIHRVVTDQSRLTKSFYNTALGSGISDGEYVETIGVIATVIAIDGFTRAIGLPEFELPDPEPGEPSRHRPIGAKIDRAWVPTVAPEDATDAEAGLYDGLPGVNIHRALSLVPEETISFFNLDAVHYLPPAQVRDFGTEHRNLSHVQIEFLAARISALNQCVY